MYSIIIAITIVTSVDEHGYKTLCLYWLMPKFLYHYVGLRTNYFILWSLLPEGEEESFEDDSLGLEAALLLRGVHHPCVEDSNKYFQFSEDSYLGPDLLRRVEGKPFIPIDQWLSL